MVPADLTVYGCSMDRRALGRAGEDAVAAALAARGHVILCRNVRTRYGEIDLVTADREVLVFVQVKTRTGDDYGRPLEAVEARKQRRLARLARAFMQDRGLSNRACRFDTAAVLMTATGASFASRSCPMRSTRPPRAVTRRIASAGQGRVRRPRVHSSVCWREFAVPRFLGSTRIRSMSRSTSVEASHPSQSWAFRIPRFRRRESASGRRSETPATMRRRGGSQ